MLLTSNHNIENIQINGKNILADIVERYCYSKDANNIDLGGKIPELVVFPETIEDVQNVVKYANENNIPIVSRGAGTNMVGACLCNKGGIVLNFSKMNKILEINSQNMTARVQPGVVLGDLKRIAEDLGLFYPPDPSSYKVATIGGSIAQSSGGALSFKYGTTKDYVLSLKVVTADGKLIQLGANTSKNASGYHMAQLMVGSEGTLAIIVEALLKLIPKPETKRTVIAYFNKINDAVNLVNRIIEERIFPSTIDFMDKNAMLTSEEFMRCGLKTENECLLLIDVDGNEASINSDLANIKNLLKKTNVTEYIIANSEVESEHLWEARRVSFSATTRLAPDVVSDDIIVPRENLAKMFLECKKICEKYKLKLSLVGHIGDGNLHPQIALNLQEEEEFKNYMMAKSEIYKTAINLNGTISAEHGIGLEKKSYLINTVGSESIEYMKMIKKVFDPNGILNPGKIF